MNQLKDVKRKPQQTTKYLTFYNNLVTVKTFIKNKQYKNVLWEIKTVCD